MPQGESAVLRELAPDLWVTEQPLRFGGVELGTRMSVIRLRDGGLFLHSPVPIDPKLRRGLDALGPVRFAVAPNRFHHLYIAEYPLLYPEMKLFAAPGLEHKRKDIAWEGILDDHAPPAWAGEIDQLFFPRLDCLINEASSRGWRLLLIDAIVRRSPTRRCRLAPGIGRPSRAPLVHSLSPAGRRTPIRGRLIAGLHRLASRGY